MFQLDPLNWQHPHVIGSSVWMKDGVYFGKLQRFYFVSPQLNVKGKTYYQID